MPNEQQNNEVISEVLKALKNKMKSSKFKNKDIRCLLRHRNQLIIKKQLLYRQYVDSITGTEMLQFVLPTLFCEKALQACYNNAGHLGIKEPHIYWKIDSIGPGCKQTLNSM